MENQKEKVEGLNGQEKKVEESKKQVKKILKGFEIVEDYSERTGRPLNKLVVKTQKDKECVLFLSDDQKEVVDTVGLDNCSVEIEQRRSKDNRVYDVIAFHVGEFVFDFFTRNKAFIPLAKLHAKNA